MLTRSSVILPAAVASAFSSKGFILSKNCSTFAALFVSAPRSISSAPKDTKPSGIFIRPYAMPDRTDSTTPTSLSTS